MRKSAAFVLMAVFVTSCSDPCRNDPISTADAPREGMKAVLFQRDCGATTGFSSQVSLAEGSGAPSGAGNIFIADTDNGAASAASWGGPWVELRWLGPKHLLIRYDAGARVFMQSESVSGVNISYEKIAR
jgi:hypothetical protein